MTPTVVQVEERSENARVYDVQISGDDVFRTLVAVRLTINRTPIDGTFTTRVNGWHYDDVTNHLDLTIAPANGEPIDD